MSFGDDDLAMMLDDAFAVAVILPGPVTTSGIVDYHDLTLFDEDGQARVVGRERAVSILTSLATALSHGDAITVDGTAYVVREKLAQGDGAKTLVFLRG